MCLGLHRRDRGDHDVVGEFESRPTRKEQALSARKVLSDFRHDHHGLARRVRESKMSLFLYLSLSFTNFGIRENVAGSIAKILSPWGAFNAQVTRIQLPASSLGLALYQSRTECGCE